MNNSNKPDFEIDHCVAHVLRLERVDSVERTEHLVGQCNIGFVEMTRAGHATFRAMLRAMGGSMNPDTDEWHIAGATIVLRKCTCGA
jgi:hypothetical protein